MKGWLSNEQRQILLPDEQPMKAENDAIQHSKKEIGWWLQSRKEKVGKLKQMGNTYRFSQLKHTTSFRIH
ncbi:hypothetical protein BCR33DRAFT_721491 [Rhizoclosmatium globosum]|uniref:Uncharacterized protein n=1 Tax=Rhizoclosmatium globosum TaxID=329046 RepID=A0A1Y2BRR0_9FUNG|nr:hypothetical protein BCR33DRAFT_721491 [Rhizoclosmatium globosum]|eukprot:ORY37442.1 hypothetical protein BCR33DRAFT_721491 [Rhizoclosmatium globosum]